MDGDDDRRCVAEKRACDHRNPTAVDELRRRRTVADRLEREVTLRLVCSEVGSALAQRSFRALRLFPWTAPSFGG